MKLRNFLSDNFSVGKGAIKLPIESLLDDYREKYKNLPSKPKVNIYKMTSSGNSIAHIEIPSETVPGFHYDVLLELNMDNAKDYEDCHIKVFSNSPSFVYSYAYVFYHFEDTELKTTGMIVDKYHQKIPKSNLMVKAASDTVPEEVLTRRAVIRNPLGIPLFDKTIYFGVFALMDQVPFATFKRNMKLIADRAIYVKVENFEKLMARRKRLAAIARNQKQQIKKLRLVSVKSDNRAQERQHRSNSSVTHIKSNSGGVRKVQSVQSSVSHSAQKNSGGVRRIRGR